MSNDNAESVRAALYASMAVSQVVVVVLTELVKDASWKVVYHPIGEATYQINSYLLYQYFSVYPIILAIDGVSCSVLRKYVYGSTRRSYASSRIQST
jgi:hypothetical protein